MTSLALNNWAHVRIFFITLALINTAVHSGITLLRELSVIVCIYKHLIAYLVCLFEIMLQKRPEFDKDIS